MKIAYSKLKRFLVVAMILVFAVTLVACNYKPAVDSTMGGSSQGGNQSGSGQGGSQSGTNHGDGNQGGSQGGDVTVDEDVYTVRFSEKIPYAYIAGIQVIWTDIESINGAFYSAYFDKDGVASVSGLDGDYRVTLSATPEGYTYNPNIYFANSDSKDITIKLFELLEPDNASTATGLDRYHSFLLSSTGAYRAVLTADNFENGLWFTYKPTLTGNYSFESMIDITQNKLNPILDQHNGTFAFVTEFPSQTVNDGGESNTFTKNFRWEVTLKSVGNVYHFRLYAETLDKGVFPLYVDFILDRDGELTNGSANNTQRVEVTHDFDAIADVAYSDIAGSFRWYGNFDGNNTILDGSKVFYAGDGAQTPEEKKANDYYYVIDSNGNKKILYAKIDGAFVFEEEDGKGFSNPLLKNRKIEGRDENNNVCFYYYDEFITTYATKAVKDGCYPVTAELKLLLQRYSIWQSLFRDGEGGAEAYFMSSETNQWLFDCGVFI